jgi:putative tricarboxylic transport membrane protein
MDSILLALQTVFTPTILFYMIAGTAAGTIIGALPGLGSVLAITLALPLTFVLGRLPASPCCSASTAVRSMVVRFPPS